MLLHELIARIPGARLHGGDAAHAGIRPVAVAGRSDRVVPGALYCAVRGLTVDGHDFAADAVARGAGR